MSKDKWISVHDMLPPDNEDVLAIIEDEDGHWLEISSYSHHMKTWSDSRGECLDVCDCDVIYWQPLPELPEELRCKE